MIPADVPAAVVYRTRDEITEMLDRAKALVIKDEADYSLAGSIGTECARRIITVESELEESRATADAAHKAITRLIAKLVNPYKQIKSILGEKADAWYRAEKWKREEEAARVRAAEQKRLDDEKLAKAEALEEAGDPEMAEAVLNEKTVVATPKVEMPKVAGVSHSGRWKAEVVDFKALVHAVVAGKAPYAFLLPNEQALNAMARSLTKIAEVPGVRFYVAGGTAFRG
jgi:hypothetical protein